MKKILFYLIILIASVWLGLKVAESPGYVLVTYQSWALETTLWFAVFAVFISFSLAYFVLRLFNKTINAPATYRSWRERRQEAKSRKLTQQGMRALAEGDFTKAEKILLKSLPDSENPLMNYLLAANAAQGKNDIRQRDEYLREALNCSEGAEIAVGLTQAQLQLDTQQLEQALATLEHLYSLEPKNAQVMLLLQRVYLDLEDWDGLRQLLPKLQKHNVLSVDDFAALEQKVNAEIFKTGAPRFTVDELHAAWKDLPKRLHADPEIVVLYCDALENHQQHAEAEKIIRKALSINWDAAVVRRYGRIKSLKPGKQLNTAEAWLKNHPNDPDLLICLGQLCLQNKLWGKARSAFESAANHQPSVRTLRSLAQVYEQLGDKELALDRYRDAVELSLES